MENKNGLMLYYISLVINLFLYGKSYNDLKGIITGCSLLFFRCYFCRLLYYLHKCPIYVDPVHLLACIEYNKQHTVT